MIIEEEIKKILQVTPTMSNRDIARKLQCGHTTVKRYLDKLLIKRDRKLQQKLNNTNRNKPLSLTGKAIEILIGTILGDSSITKYIQSENSKKILNSRITCAHSMNQKEYILHLQNLLVNEGLVVYYTEKIEPQINSIKGKMFISNGRCDIISQRNITFNLWRDQWYVNDKKIVPINIITHISPLSLAIWYMDDGSKTNRSYYLHTEGFSIDCIKYLQYILIHKFNIYTTIQKIRHYNVLYISLKSKQLFYELIHLHIIPSMKYKL